jgi:hypothetical protein
MATMMRHLMAGAGLLTVVLVALGQGACSKTSDSGGMCASAGGTCLLGGNACTKQAAASAQDCNPDNNPGGAFCCLEVAGEDSGVPSDAGDGGVSSDAGEGGIPLECNGGCLCFTAETCPAGCYVSHTSASESFCANGIVPCVDGGIAWSMGTPANNCPAGPTTYLDGGGAPSGAFCCDSQPTNVAADGGQDASAE